MMTGSITSMCSGKDMVLDQRKRFRQPASLLVTIATEQPVCPELEHFYHHHAKPSSNLWICLSSVPVGPGDLSANKLSSHFAAESLCPLTSAPQSRILIGSGKNMLDL